MREGERVAGRFLLKKRMTGGNRTRTDVWLAYDERMERDVVLKRDRLEARRAGGQVTVEPRAMAKFNHPHVVSVFEVVSLDGDDWFVLEYAPAGKPRGRAEGLGGHPKSEVRCVLTRHHPAGADHRCRPAARGAGGDVSTRPGGPARRRDGPATARVT